MILNLRSRPDHWVVYYLQDREAKFERFKTIELAADFMLSKGLNDDAIDEALIAIHTGDHSIAIFRDGKTFDHTLRE